MADRLQKHFDARMADVAEKKQRRLAESAVEQASAQFHREFGDLRDEITLKLESASELSSEERPALFDNVSATIRRLQVLLADASSFLPSYDIRQSQATISDLSALQQTKQDELLPKAKFSFKSRRKAAGDTSKKTPTVTQTEPESTTGLAVTDSSVDRKAPAFTGCGFHDRCSEILILEDDVQGRDVMLSNLEDCVVCISGGPSTLHLHKVKNCRILCGPVKTSVFAEECQDSTIVLACQQLRLHHCHGSQVYLHVTSRAIIEDCSTLQFAPYLYSYPGKDRDYQITGLNEEVNNWSDVADFNWASKEHSPNWSLLPESNRKHWSHKNISLLK